VSDNIYENIKNGTHSAETPTATETVKHSNAPQPKVVAATIGAGVGFAVGEVATYIIETAAGIDIPTNVEQAIGLILTAGLSFIAGYVKKN
jgi:RsiW-degrading membrane proteinase PrsW (M82 family)